jgi:hypothetical protein
MILQECVGGSQDDPRSGPGVPQQYQVGRSVSAKHIFQVRRRVSHESEPEKSLFTSCVEERRFSELPWSGNYDDTQSQE